MPTLLELSSDLVAQIPGLPNILARKYINKALYEVEKDYLWSWNINEGILICPAAISDGTVSVEQFSQYITFDATAQASLLTQQTATPSLIERQFRVSSGGPIYNLIGYDFDTGIGTLDRIYTEATDSASTYQIYRCYYTPPSTDGIVPNSDFKRYLSILNPIQGYAITGKRLYMTRQDLNRRDPMRGAQGQPYYASAYKPTANGLVNGQVAKGPTDGLMQYELWPHPVSQLTLQALYERQHVDLNANEYIPNQCPAPLITYRALDFAYRWAIANQGRVLELKGSDFRFLLADNQKTYALELAGAKRNDKEIMLQIIRPGYAENLNFLGPIDSNFAQSHGWPQLS